MLNQKHHHIRRNIAEAPGFPQAERLIAHMDTAASDAEPEALPVPEGILIDLENFIVAVI